MAEPTRDDVAGMTPEQRRALLAELRSGKQRLGPTLEEQPPTPEEEETAKRVAQIQPPSFTQGLKLDIVNRQIDPQQLRTTLQAIRDTRAGSMTTDELRVLMASQAPDMFQLLGEIGGGAMGGLGGATAGGGMGRAAGEGIRQQFFGEPDIGNIAKEGLIGAGTSMIGAGVGKAITAIGGKMKGLLPGLRPVEGQLAEISAKQQIPLPKGQILEETSFGAKMLGAESIRLNEAMAIKVKNEVIGEQLKVSRGQATKSIIQGLKQSKDADTLLELAKRLKIKGGKNNDAFEAMLQMSEDNLEGLTQKFMKFDDVNVLKILKFRFPEEFAILQKAKLFEMTGSKPLSTSTMKGFFRKFNTIKDKEARGLLVGEKNLKLMDDLEFVMDRVAPVVSGKVTSITGFIERVAVRGVQMGGKTRAASERLGRALGIFKRLGEKVSKTPITPVQIGAGVGLAEGLRQSGVPQEMRSMRTFGTFAEDQTVEIDPVNIPMVERDLFNDDSLTPVDRAKRLLLLRKHNRILQGTTF